MSGETLAMKAELDASGVASGFQQINSHLSQFGIQTGTASTSLGGLGTMLGTLANPMTAVAAGALAVGSAISSSVGVAGNFQQTMAGVNAIMGGSAADMQTLSNAAREAGATTQFSATQAGEALGYMAGAGWDVQDSTVALKDTLTLAAAGGMDLAEAGDLMTNTVAQFGLAATDSARVSNVLAAGAAATNTSVSLLGAGMKVVGTTASAFGMNLESTTAALGSLSNAGIKGAEGGTALRGILASLATQSGPAAAALSELGVSAVDIDPATHSLSESMGLLNEKGMTAAQAIQIFGRENVSAATYLAAHADSLDGLQTSITGTSKASEMAAIQTATYQGAMGELSSAVEEAQISLGDALLPTLTEGVKFFTDLVTVGTAAGKAIYDFAGDVNTALGPVKEAFSYTPMGMITGAVSDTASSVWGDLKGWAGIGDEAGSAVAEGVAGNEDLATAPADAMTSDTAKAATKDAAGESAKEFSKEWIEEFETQQADREIAKILARSGELTVDKGNVAGTATTTLENGLEIEVAYQGNSKGIYSRLFIDGQQIGDGVWGANREEVLPKLLSQWEYDQANILDLTDRKGEADILRKQKELQIEFDYSGISAIFGDQFVTRLENEGSRISQTASEEVQSTYQSLLDALKEPTWDNLDEVLSQMDSLVAEHELDPSEATLWATRYKETLVAGIVDIGEFAKDKAASSGDTISKAFEDHFLDIDERKAIAALDPMLETIKAESPEAFGEAGLASIEKFVEMAKNGASSEELYAYFREMGLKSGEEFTEFNTTAFKELDFSEWIKAPNWDNILNPSDYIANVFQPKVLDAAATALKDLSSGEDAAYNSGNELIMSMKEIAAVSPELFTAEQQQALKNYDGNLLKLSDTLEILSKKTEKNTSALKEYKEAMVWLPDSSFGQWQEGAESGLFYESYIGASYGANFENYLKKLSSQYADTANSAERLAAAHRGEYIAPSVADLSLDIDTTQADTKLQNVETNINKIIELTSKPQYMEIQFVKDKNQAQEATTNTSADDSLEVVISTTEANNKLTSISQELADIQTAAQAIKVDADTTAAHKELDDLMADIAALRPKVKVEVDISADATEIQILAEEAVTNAIRNASV